MSDPWMRPVTMTITDPPVSHYPVTPRYWRGVFRPCADPVRRACDWRRAAPDKADRVFDLAPSCPDCRAYRLALRRLGAFEKYRNKQG